VSDKLCILQVVVASAASLKLQQRALHVWGEVERVKQFRSICASLAEAPSQSGRDKWQAFTTRELLQHLGVVMNGSHQSCRTLYECSCPELDALSTAALSAGALGARLTGAGWGGCIVALVRKAEVATFMQALETSYYKERGLTPAEANAAMFESAPASGADIFTLQSN
jgi:galactokinase